MTPVTTIAVKAKHLALRGCLVQVTNGTGRCSSKERWFAVGISLQREAEAAVCRLSQIGPTDAVFARRPLNRVEIETLSLQSGQVVECCVSNDTIRPVVPKTLIEQPS